jgi:hypothetical protein
MIQWPSFLMAVGVSALVSASDGPSTQPRLDRQWELRLAKQTRSAPRFALCADGTLFVAPDGDRLVEVKGDGRVSSDQRHDLLLDVHALACSDTGRLYLARASSRGHELLVRAAAGTDGAFRPLPLADLPVLWALAPATEGGLWLLAVGPGTGMVHLIDPDGQILVSIADVFDSVTAKDRLDLLRDLLITWDRETSRLHVIHARRYEVETYSARGGRVARLKREDEGWTGSRDAFPPDRVHAFVPLGEARNVAQVSKKQPLAAGTFRDDVYLEVLDDSGHALSGPISPVGFGRLIGRDGKGRLYFWRMNEGSVVVSRAALFGGSR